MSIKELRTDSLQQHDCSTFKGGDFTLFIQIRYFHSSFLLRVSDSGGIVFSASTMAPNIEISIPTTTISTTPKPYTIYNITLRLPLRTFTVQKRYSDFPTFHDALTSQVGSPPPAPLPTKSWFSKTTTNPAYKEQRRKGLEEYLCAINDAEDSRWRNSSAWRAFLNLPNSAAMGANGSRASNLHTAITGPGGGGGPITDPTMWLDCLRDAKSQLHDARLHLTNRDQAKTPQKQHESSAQAKACLVKSGTMIGALEEGLKNLGDKSTFGGCRLGDGELRRRKDLVESVKKDRDGLENLLNAMATKSKLDSAVASIQDKAALVGDGKPKPGRVLGKETDQTRELDNEGVLQLQKQVMEDQDMSVNELMKIVHRQKELGTAIHDELEVQNQMLNMADEDTSRYISLTVSEGLLLIITTSRLQRKLDVGKKRLGKIS